MFVYRSFSQIKEILMYPKEGQGRLSINTEDYVCLGVDQFLNDKIIDFYLKYLWENLPTEQQEKVHVFSTFFYKRLTTKPTKAARWVKLLFCLYSSAKCYIKFTVLLLYIAWYCNETFREWVLFNLIN